MFNKICKNFNYITHYIFYLNNTALQVSVFLKNQAFFWKKAWFLVKRVCEEQYLQKMLFPLTISTTLFFEYPFT